MITHSFGTNGQFKVVDWTEELVTIPNNWGQVGQLGLFEEIPVAEHVIQFEETNVTGGLIVDRVRGDRTNVNGPQTSKIHTFAVPHFPLDDAILPQDVQGVRAYGKANDVDTKALARIRKMERIRRDHAWTLEYARCQLITAGTVYSPTGTVTQDWNTEFGWTRKVVDFAFSVSTTEVGERIEAFLANLQDDVANGGFITGVTVLCSPQWFSKLITHASIKTAYQFYASTVEPLRQRNTTTGAGATGLIREFTHLGVRFMEIRGNYNGSLFVPANEAYAVAEGTDAFKTYFSPANKFDFVNTLGMPVYLFETESPKGDKIELESEANFVNALLRPGAVVKLTMS